MRGDEKLDEVLQQGTNPLSKDLNGELDAGPPREYGQFCP